MRIRRRLGLQRHQLRLTGIQVLLLSQQTFSLVQKTKLSTIPAELWAVPQSVLPLLLRYRL
jgi:hypothetical protein